jgi:hypothetical protein
LVKKEIDYMVQEGIWEPIEKSEWVHQLVTVMRANGQPRITTDLSPLNKFVIPQRYPLPNIKDLFLELNGAKVFSKIDLRRGYYHIELCEESRPLTATLTHWGLYQYKRLPMGLCDSASAFQQAVSSNLVGLEGVLDYIDDILVYGNNKEEHDRRLLALLERLHSRNFRFNLEKCIFGTDEVEFLGHLISGSAGIRPHPKNVQPILDATAPTTVTEVQKFLGMINYYAEFMEDLASIAEPLRELTRKDVSFAWTPTRQLAFDTLKSMAAQKLQNFIFDSNSPTFVTTDASDVGLGAVLSQIQNGQEVPIALAAHSLNSAERNYSTSERECLACVWGCEHFDKFLLGREFTLRTDHKALESLLQRHWSKRESGKFGRWFNRLAIFKYKVEHIRGSDNKVADALSRLVSRANSLGVPSNDLPAIEDHQLNCRINMVNASGITTQEIISETATDVLLQKVTEMMKLPEWPRKSKISQDLYPFFDLRHELSDEGGYLTRAEDRILIPTSLQRKILAISHQGHPGIVRAKRKLRESYWWPGMRTDVDRLIRHCQGCQASDKSNSPASVPTTIIPTPSKVWEKLAIDITGPFSTAPKNQQFVVVLIDYFSKYPEILTTGSITSTRIIDWLKETFARYGNPKELVSDNGPQFISDEFTKFLRDRDIRHIRSAVYNPQENGLVEVFNKFLKFGTQTFTADHTPWNQGLQSLLFHFRATSPTPDAPSPGELFFNRRMHMNHEVSRHSNSEEGNKGKKDTQSNYKPPKKNFNPLANRGPYRRGDRVRVKRPHTLKGQSPFSKPMTVLECLGNWTYKLSDGQRWNARRIRRHFPPLDESLESEVIRRRHPIARRDIIARPVVDPPRTSTRMTRGQPPDRYSPPPILQKKN